MKTATAVVILVSVLGAVISAVEDCPPDFERVPGVDDERCFYYYVDSDVTFQDGSDICKRKANGTKVWEPQTFQEGETIYNWVFSTGSGCIWINYRDMHGSYNLVGDGANQPILVETDYMGSMSTLGKLPNEWWQSYYQEGNYRFSGAHCAEWCAWADIGGLADGQGQGVGDMYCTWYRTLVCESGAYEEKNLKQYLNLIDGTVADN